MNDEERDRCSDGAGPSANDDSGPYQRKSHKVIGYILTIMAVCASTMVNAQMARGLSMSVHAGTLFADNYQSDFYSGIPSNANTIERILHSQAYGYNMWLDLMDQGLITSNIGNYRQLQVEEYGRMSYRMAVQLGMGFRYDFGRNWAWLARFDYAKLTAVGQFLLASGRNNAVSLTNQDAYVACPIMGQEKRIMIDLGISHRFDINDDYYLAADLGASLNNTKVLASRIQVAGQPYSILDVWGGQYPDAGMMGYEYYNQGGIGYGGFFTLALGMNLGNGNSARLHYTLYYTRTTLEGYTAFNPQNLIGISFELGNFSFLG